MDAIFQSDLTDLSCLSLKESKLAEVVTWQGRKCLHLSGSALLKEHNFRNSRSEVWICAEGSCYPGIIFNASDQYNYELVYSQPHTSGRWDAIQYDPVFHGSNTWQIYHGEAYQAVADVPTGDWFHFRVDCVGEHALVWVNGIPHLHIQNLAHPNTSGLAGIWSHLPAYFSNLQISSLNSLDEFPVLPISPAPGKVIDSWLLKGYGIVTCEPNGILNLNRFLPNFIQEVHLHRNLCLSNEAVVQINAGFSDIIEISLDGKEIFKGENFYQNSPDWNRRGYISWKKNFDIKLSAGEHEISVLLKHSEPHFGFGLCVSVSGAKVEFLPVEIG